MIKCEQCGKVGHDGVDCVTGAAALDQRLVDKLLGDARTKEFQPLHTASDLADARRAGYEAAREQAARIVFDDRRFNGPNSYDALACRDIAKDIRAMVPDGETT